MATPPTTTALPVASACCAPLGAAALSAAQAEATARRFKALADPARVRIVNRLATSSDPVCVCEFTQPLGLSQPRVSHHLKKLLDAGLLEREQRGTWAYYRRRRDALGGLAAALDLQEPAETTQPSGPDALREQVRARYAAAATKLTGGDCGCGQPADCGCRHGCCGVATAEEPGFGAERYAALDRDQLPTPRCWPAWAAATRPPWPSWARARRCWTWARGAASTCWCRPGGSAPPARPMGST